MKIFVHDYAGHPLQVDLSRELAVRGHEVNRVFYGTSARRAARDRPSIPIARPTGVKCPPLRQGVFQRRRFDDVAYGRRLQNWCIRTSRTSLSSAIRRRSAIGHRQCVQADRHEVRVLGPGFLQRRRIAAVAQKLGPLAPWSEPNTGFLAAAVPEPMGRRHHKRLLLHTRWTGTEANVFVSRIGVR